MTLFTYVNKVFVFNVKERDCEVLVDAAKYIDDDAIIHIAGAGPLHDSLQEKINNCKLNSKVKLLGRLSDEELKLAYQNCYLYCFPSVERGEMMGMEQYEALSYGKPIISANIPRSSAPTINEDGVTGFKFSVYDSKALAEKINVLIRDEKLYETFCNNAIIVSNNFNNNSKIENYVECFKDILKND